MPPCQGLCAYLCVLCASALNERPIYLDAHFFTVITVPVCVLNPLYVAAIG